MHLLLGAILDKTMVTKIIQGGLILWLLSSMSCLIVGYFL